MALNKKLLSLEAYHAFLDAPENEGRLFEFIDGEMVEKMPSYEPSRIALVVAFYLQLYLRQHPIGTVTGADGGYIMPNGDVLIPDVAFISHARRGAKPAREVPVPPDLAIEVMSPTDSLLKLRRKAEKYVALGTALVWLVLPADHSVEVYAAGQPVASVGLEGTLSGAPVLPDFTLPVAELFSEPPTP